MFSSAAMRGLTPLPYLVENKDMENVPIINMTELETPDTARALDEACRDWGFFQVIEHGVTNQTFTDLTQAMHRFFAQDSEAKQRLERTAENPWGYYDRELTKNVRDWKEVFDVGPEIGEQRPQWPEEMGKFRAAVETFYWEAERVARAVLSILARNLGTEPYVLLSAFEEHTSFLRLNYYPPCPDAASPDAPTVPTNGKLGIGHHSDAGALTVLYQADQPGLQVERDGAWHTVEPISNALVVNLGDIVQVWSNDRYRAALHRVIANSTLPRYSAPFFFNPSYATSYAPLKSACQTQAPRYRPINWGEFRRQRADGDFADYGEEVQLSQFRIET